MSGNQDFGVSIGHSYYYDVSYIRNSTIHGNGGVGISISGVGNIHLQGSIVSGNTGGSFTERYDYDSFIFPSFSLIDNNAGTRLEEAPPGSPDGAGNLVGGPINGIIDPQLGPLQDNGGPTFTHALLTGSPAIDAHPSAPQPGQYDQRGEGFIRVVNGRIDIGAFEVQAPVSGDFDGDGDIDGRDFLAWQRGGSPTPFSSGDLELWQEEYGTGGLSALGSRLSAGTLQSSLNGHSEGGLPTEESGFNHFPSIYTNTVATQILRSPRLSQDDSFAIRDTQSEISHTEAVDRALEELADVSRYGVNSFGEMVARRGVKRIADWRLRIAE